MPLGVLSRDKIGVRGGSGRAASSVRVGWPEWPMLSPSLPVIIACGVRRLPKSSAGRWQPLEQLRVLLLEGVQLAA